MFRQKPITYLIKMNKVLFATNYLTGIIRNKWKLEDKQITANFTCSHTYTWFCKFLQELIKPAHICQAETMVRIGNMRQQSNQLIQSLIVALKELEEQQNPPLSNDQRMTDLFFALDEKLQNEVVRFEKTRAIHEGLKISIISLEKILANTETSSQKDNPSSGQNCKPQSQCSDAMWGQKQKPKEGKQAGPKGSKDPKNKEPQLKYYNCDKTEHIAKECCAPKKEKGDRKSLGKGEGQ